MRMDADMARAVGPDYERDVLVWIERLLEGRPPPVVYDVGASFGFQYVFVSNTQLQLGVALSLGGR